MAQQIGIDLVGNRHARREPGQDFGQGALPGGHFDLRDQQRCREDGSVDVIRMAQRVGDRHQPAE